MNYGDNEMNKTVDDLVIAYGEGSNYPSRSQWEQLLQGDMGRPLTVLNFFKLRSQADTTIIADSMTGEKAFEMYAETSVPKVAEVGGHFVLRGMVEGLFVGDASADWHIIAIGQYPKRENFLALINDREYQNAFKYRQAAVEKQEVYFIDAM